MKRTKLLLSTFVALLLAVIMAFSLTACGNGNNNGNDGGKEDQFGITDMSSDTLALKGISLGGNYKTEFALGSAFSSEGLVVTATLNDYAVSDMVTTDVVLNAGEYEVDSSDYMPNRVGTYIIYVSYTRTEVTCTAHYYVTVKSAVPEIGGIVVKLAEGATDTYTLSESQPSITISKDILEVYELGADGSQTLLAADKYNADLYLGSQKIEGNAANQNGTYSLVVTLAGDASKQDFISVYVINGVVKIQLDDKADSVFEQEAGSVDSISGTWQFTVTYSNGTTKTLKAGDAGLTIDIDTKAVGNDKTGTITYTENGIDVNCTVTYTITAKTVDGDSVNYVMYYTVVTTDATNKVGSFVTTYGDNEDLESNVTVTSTASNFLTREKSTEDNSVTLSDYAEVKNYSSKNITVKIGANVTNATITVYTSHTSSDARTLYLATATTADDTSSVIDSKTIGGDGLIKDNLHMLEGDSLGAGEYYIFSDSSTVHVYQVVVTYTVANDNGGSSVAPETITVTSDEATGYPDGGVYTEATAWGDSGILTILPECKVNSSKKTVDGEEIQNRLQTAGGAATSKKSIEIDLTGSEYQGYVANVQVVFYVGSSDTRYLKVVDSTGAEYTAGTIPTENRATATQLVETVALQGGAKYYLGGSNGVNIYKIVITFEEA